MRVPGDWLTGTECTHLNSHMLCSTSRMPSRNNNLRPQMPDGLLLHAPSRSAPLPHCEHRTGRRPPPPEPTATRRWRYAPSANILTACGVDAVGMRFGSLLRFESRVRRWEEGWQQKSSPKQRRQPLAYRCFRGG